MESLFWSVLYPLRADLMRVKIDLCCDTDLKIPPTVGAHSKPPRGSNKKKV